MLCAECDVPSSDWSCTLYLSCYIFYIHLYSYFTIWYASSGFYCWFNLRLPSGCDLYICVTVYIFYYRNQSVILLLNTTPYILFDWMLFRMGKYANFNVPIVELILFKILIQLIADWNCVRIMKSFRIKYPLAASH